MQVEVIVHLEACTRMFRLREQPVQRPCIKSKIHWSSSGDRQENERTLRGALGGGVPAVSLRGEHGELGVTGWPKQ